MGVVNVTNLKTCTLAGQTTWTECRNAALVRHFRQRVRLVHELRELVRSEEAVDDRTQGLGINQIGRCKDLVVTHIHALADGTRHTRQSHTELAVQLLPYRSDAAVRQVVNVIDVRVRVHQIQEVLDDEQDVILGQRSVLNVFLNVQFAVDTESSHLTQIVALLREEQLINHPTRCVQIWWLSIAKLAVDVLHSFFLRVGAVLLERVVDDGVIGLVDILLVQDDGLGTGISDQFDVLLFQDGLTVEHHLVPLDAHHFTRILIHKVFDPRLQNTCGQASTNGALQACLGDLYFVCEAKDIEDVAVRFEADGTQQCRHGQLFLSVDVRVHHAVDVGREFNPRTLERNDSRAVQLGTVRVAALTEEHTG